MKLEDLVDPRHTAVLVSEMQRGIVGDCVSAELSAIADAVASSGIVPAIAALAKGARSSQAPVVHTTLQFRPNRAGVRIVTPLMAVTMRDPEYLLAGSAGAEVLPELRPHPADIVAARFGGMSAFTNTDLDALLRSLDITTVIIVGVSLNEAIIGAAIEAVNLGYRVVIPRDAVLGIPQKFADDMLEHAFSLLASIPTTDDILLVWGTKDEETGDVDQVRAH